MFNNPITRSLYHFRAVIVAIGMIFAAQYSAAAQDLYQLHQDGKIWRYTGQPCNGNSCPGWQMLDNNPNTRVIIVR